MSNNLTKIQNKILARGLMALREIAMMPRLVNVDYSMDAAKKGATIDVPVPKAQTTSDVTPANTPPVPASNTPDEIQISLNNWKHSDFHLTDKELMEIDANEHFMPMQTSEVIRALANDVDITLHDEGKKFYGFVGTAGTTPFSTLTDVTDTRVRLGEQLAPVDGRNMVLNPTAEGKALNLDPLRDIEKAGDRTVPIEGELGRKLGFDFFMSQNVQTHVRGTAADAITVASTTAVGASTIGLTASASGTMVLGDVFTIAGDDQTYVVNTTVTVSTDTSVSFSPLLQAEATSGAVVTVKATHVNNLAFTRGAIALATRPLQQDGSEFVDSANIAQLQDPVSGLILRLELMRQYKQQAWDFDILWGTGTPRRDFGVRIAG